MSDFSYVSAPNIAETVRAKKVSPAEVLEDTIARIEARNPSLNAIVYKGYEDARAAAAEAGRKVMKGEPLGPLHGVPIAIKDLFDFKPGWPATFGGIRALKDFRLPIQMPFMQEVPILSRMRLAVASRSDGAKEKRMFSVNLPMEVVVLRHWDTKTKVTSFRSEKSASP